MFKIEKERLVKGWPATVTLAQDNGETESHAITLDLLLLDVEQSDKVLRYFKEDVKKVIKGWSGIGDANGKPLEYTAENLDLVMSNPAFMKTAVDAYLKANSGQAVEKNS
ncbi:hypothetical protein [Vibrio nigripulchritudo]|uniref:hypothetical protein n=1 Tax=Vibrio nigripulchritudo TaxID=28173 RepID=UPI0003B22571|nr:hypothetical protein [Vibrio nigripulchritudo]CCN69788.1 conserved hypothetical protein [Vibrio nigripulchritudo SFn118]